MAIKCQCKDAQTPADPSMECFINSPKHFNCFEVYKFFIHGEEHTLHECAKLMNISHTTVKQIELSALKKIKELVKSGVLSADQLKDILKPTKD